MIEISNLRKTYSGGRGLVDFSMSVPDGSLCGLVGPNGAGKSTLIKTLCTLLKADSGSAKVAGIDVRSEPFAVKKIVGYLPDVPGLYQDMGVREFLEFFFDAFHLPASEREARISRALTRAGLADRGESAVEELSLGLKQRLLLAKTLLHEPKVLLLDEPATGLDPLARVELRDHLRTLNREGVTILLSSHILSDLEEICTDVVLIADGKNVTGTTPSTTSGTSSQFEVEILGDFQIAVDRARSIPGCTVLETATPVLVLQVTGGQRETAAALRQLVNSGSDVIRFGPRTAGLEERYRSIFGGSQK